VKSFVWRRAGSIAKKEVHHILRDYFTLIIAVGLPVMMVVFFGYVFDFDTRDIRLIVFDRDQSILSREFVEIFSASKYFRVDLINKAADPIKLIEGEKARAVMVIEPEFAKNIRRGQTAKVQLFLDGADNQSAGIIASYLTGVNTAALKRIVGREAEELVKLQTRFLYNSELNSRWFVVPGLVVVVVGILSILLTALTVAREWETGSMELLLSTPVRPMEIMAGKLAPYTVLCLGGVALVYFAARVWFGIPFRGNHLLFLVTCLMFLTTNLSQGMVISVITRQQQLAMQLAQITGLLPNLLLSGFIFPVESMPSFFQYLTSVLPARWFMIICRSLFLRGAGVFDLTKPLLALAALNVLFLAVAAKKFKKDLE